MKEGIEIFSDSSAARAFAQRKGLGRQKHVHVSDEFYKWTVTYAAWASSLELLGASFTGSSSHTKVTATATWSDFKPQARLRVTVTELHTASAVSKVKDWTSQASRERSKDSALVSPSPSRNKKYLVHLSLLLLHDNLGWVAIGARFMDFWNDDLNLDGLPLMPTGFMDENLGWVATDDRTVFC
eukprot:1054195-Amphidinium_carterae.1